MMGSISPLSRIYEQSRVGNNVSIGDYVVIYPGAELGDAAIVEGFTQVWSGVRVERGAWLGAGVVLESPGMSAGSGQHGICIGLNCKVGAGAVIQDGVVIGEGAIVRPGSVVAQSVPPYAIVSGSPAKVIGYVENLPTSVPPRRCGIQESFPSEEMTKLGVGGVTLHRLKLVRDPRGDLSVGEFPRDIPFEPKRYFLVFNVPNEKIRGEHAHYRCHQFLVCVKGSCSVVVDDGSVRCEVRLDSPDQGIYLPPLTWGVQYKYTPDAVLLVFTSDYYNDADYIRNYSDFVRLVSGGGI